MIRVCVISPEPTPYRAPLFDQIATVEDIDLTVVYAAQTIGSREWSVPLHHRSIVLRGWLLPARRLLSHDYPVSAQIWRLLSRERPDVVVVPGWSLFAAQVALIWCRVHRVPYLITSESHAIEPRRRWTEAIKRFLLPRIVKPAAGFLVTGRMSAAFIEGYGATPLAPGTLPTVPIRSRSAIRRTLAARTATTRARSSGSSRTTSWSSQWHVCCLKRPRMCWCARSHVHRNEPTLHSACSLSAAGRSVRAWRSRRLAQACQRPLPVTSREMS